MRKGGFVNIHPVDTMIRCNPDDSLSLFYNFPDNIIADGSRIFRFGFINGNIFTIEYIQSVPGSKPQELGRILPYIVDRTVRQARSIGYLCIFVVVYGKNTFDRQQQKETCKTCFHDAKIWFFLNVKVHYINKKVS
jgi:hypothetical protein